MSALAELAGCFGYCALVVTLSLVPAAVLSALRKTTNRKRKP